jgi:hypothetical protein
MSQNSRVRPRVALGDRAGVLRSLIQDPAIGLLRIYLPRTPVNKARRRYGTYQ